MAELLKGDILLKGGHLQDTSDDLLFTGGEAVWFRGPHIENSNTHRNRLYAFLCHSLRAGGRTLCPGQRGESERIYHRCDRRRPRSRQRQRPSQPHVPSSVPLRLNPIPAGPPSVSGHHSVCPHRRKMAHPRRETSAGMRDFITTFIRNPFPLIISFPASSAVRRRLFR